MTLSDRIRVNEQIRKELEVLKTESSEVLIQAQLETDFLKYIIELDADEKGRTWRLVFETQAYEESDSEYDESERIVRAEYNAYTERNDFTNTDTMLKILEVLMDAVANIALRVRKA